MRNFFLQKSIVPKDGINKVQWRFSVDGLCSHRVNRPKYASILTDDMSDGSNE